MENNYRCYHFSNMYLPSLHAGIQSQHCLAEMFVKYMIDSTPQINKRRRTLRKWAIEDKTTIVLNGGMSGQLKEIAELFESEENPYPWATFSETEFALNGALTNVGIILPEKVYAYDKLLQEYDHIVHEDDLVGLVPELTDFEMKVVEVLRGKRLMN
jgi:hypothetical protein